MSLRQVRSIEWGRVVEVLEDLGTTTGRLAVIELLGQLLRMVPGRDVDKLIYLLHGRLGPPFEPLEFGVNEKLILRALADATGTSAGEVEKLFKRRGDLGLVAEGLLVSQPADLSLAEVYDALHNIAYASGPRAIERKIEMISNLLRRLSGLGAKYVLRILQGRLRLGIGDATILDALSWAQTGTRRLRPQIERAYNLCSDLGLIGKVLLSEGPAALERFEPQVGKPIRVTLAERLATPAEAVTKLGKAEAEPKYDGLRLQLHKNNGRIEFFTRRLEDVTGMFPDLARAALKQVKAHQAIIDGEAVVYNPETGEYLPFQVTIQRKRKYRIEEMETRYPLRLFAFDLLYVDGEDHTRKPLRERRSRLEKIIRWSADTPIQLTESLVTSEPRLLEQFFQEMVSRGLEGIMVKRLDAPYQAGQRTANWAKLKRAYRTELRDTIDVVIVGYLMGKGKRAKFGIGSLLGAVYDPEGDRYRTVSKIGSGLTEARWAEMKRLLDEIRVDAKPTQVDSVIDMDVWVEPTYVVTVQADEITRSPRHTCGKADGKPGYALRFPRTVGWIRFDKGPQDATTEQEILSMYRMQQGLRQKAA